MSEKTITYLVIAFLASFLLFGLCGEEVHSDRNGADAVRDEIRQAGIYNTEQSRTVGELEEAIEEISGTNRNLEAGEQEALAIIRECKRDLKAIRARGEAKTPES